MPAPVIGLFSTVVSSSVDVAHVTSQLENIVSSSVTRFAATVDVSDSDTEAANEYEEKCQLIFFCVLYKGLYRKFM